MLEMTFDASPSRKVKSRTLQYGCEKTCCVVNKTSKANKYFLIMADRYRIELIDKNG